MNGFFVVWFEMKGIEDLFDNYKEFKCMGCWVFFFVNVLILIFVLFVDIEEGIIRSVILSLFFGFDVFELWNFLLVEVLCYRYFDLMVFGWLGYLLSFKDFLVSSKVKLKENLYFEVLRVV